MHPQPRPVASLFEELWSEWALRLWECSWREPTGKPVCTMYISSMDHSLRLDSHLLSKVVEILAREEGCSPSAVGDALFTESGCPGSPQGQLFRQVLWKAAHPSDGEEDKIRLDRSREGYQQLDFLADLLNGSSAEVRAGGAAAHMAEALTGLCREPEVVLWTRYHSPGQAALFGDLTRFVDVDSECLECPPAAACFHAGDPEVRNYPLEFRRGTLSTRDGGPTLEIPRSGRVIVVAPGYLRYKPNGHVHRTGSRRVAPICHLLHSPARGCRTKEAGARWRYWLISGLQGVTVRSQQRSLEADLASIPPDVRLHFELSGRRLTPWYKRILGACAYSVGINTEELPFVVDRLPGRVHELPATGRPARDLLRQAVLLACELNLPRLYVHGHALDLVIRQDAPAGAAGSAAMEQEVNADLFAKSMAVRWATGRDFPDLAVASLDELWQLCLLEGLEPTPGGYLHLDAGRARGLVRSGVISHRHRCAKGERRYSVAIVPVAWIEQEPPAPRTTGLGDVSSAVSFVQGTSADYEPAG